MYLQLYRKKYFGLFLIILMVGLSAESPTFLDFESQRKLKGLGEGSAAPVMNFSSYSLRRVKELAAPQIELLPLSLFQSINTTYNSGDNDGALWQGRGYNAQLEGGFHYSNRHIQVIVNPEISFAQNLDYDILSADSWSGSLYGYPLPGIDAPQRMGDEPLYSVNPGDTMLRLSAGHFSVGIGTESIWLGPGWNNALILSNNAAGFPHIDAGWSPVDTSFGTVELRSFWGILESSAWYEREESETYLDFLTGLSVSYTPAFIPQLTLGINRTAQAPLEVFDGYGLVSSFDFGFGSVIKFGSDRYDGRLSGTFEWNDPINHLRLYGELAREDFSPNFTEVVLVPEHTLAHTLGFSKGFPTDSGLVYCVFETSDLTWSRDYYISSLDNFWGYYRHHETNLGFTHQGQVLGAAAGSGGSNQYLGVGLIVSRAEAEFFVERFRRDPTLLYMPPNDTSDPDLVRLPAQLDLGFLGKVEFPPWEFYGELRYQMFFNWQHESSTFEPGLYLALESRLSF